MPGCNIYNSDNQQLLVKFFEQVSGKDLEEQAASLASNKEIRSAKRKYISFYMVSGFDEDVTEEKVAKVAHVFRSALQSGEGTKTAFVAPDLESLSIAKMFEKYLHDEDVLCELRIFSSQEEATSWLGGDTAQWNKMREHVSQMCSL